MHSTDRAHIEELCTAAGEAARLRGHHLGDWAADSSGGVSAQCTRCGKVVYVRSGPGLGGVTGEALVEPCREPAGA